MPVLMQVVGDGSIDASGWRCQYRCNWLAKQTMARLIGAGSAAHRVRCGFSGRINSNTGSDTMAISFVHLDLTTCHHTRCLQEIIRSSDQERSKSVLDIKRNQERPKRDQRETKERSKRDQKQLEERERREIKSNWKRVNEVRSKATGRA
jgi:hypothetical protein